MVEQQETQHLQLERSLDDQVEANPQREAVQENGDVQLKEASESKAKEDKKKTERVPTLYVHNLNDKVKIEGK